MKKLNVIIICSMALLLLFFDSCSKEPVRKTLPQWNSPTPTNPAILPNPQNPPGPPNLPVWVIPNNYPVDSLTGMEFIFNNLSWAVDSMNVICVVNRPDLFYWAGRILDVSVSINGSQWMNVLMCPYPTDPFFYESWPAGILKVYVYNYAGPLLESTTSIKVRFL